MGIAAGTLDRRVTLLRAGSAEDDHGDERTTFAPLATVWASVRPAPGTERLASGENAATAPTVITIRWSRRVADLNAKDQVEYPAGSGRIYDIKAVVEIGRRDALEIAALTRADA